MKKIIINTKLYVISIFLYYILLFSKIFTWLYTLDYISYVLKWTGFILGIYLVVLTVSRSILQKKILINLFLLIILFYSQFLLIDNKCERYTSEITNIISIENNNDTYYIYVNNSSLNKNLKIICNKEIYDSVKVGPKEVYALEYRTVIFINYYSRLLTISDTAGNIYHD
jgi:hypothetical protein